MKARLICALILCAITPAFVFAEDEETERGRLPDGRAFRTDVEGNQMVDYIAELEVTIEGLNRRVYGLEDELNQKNRQLEHAGVNPNMAPAEALGERDLTTGGAAPARRIPSPQLPLGENTTGNECGPQLAALKEAIDAKQRQLDLIGNKHTTELRAQVEDAGVAETKLEQSERQIETLTVRLQESEEQLKQLSASNQILQRQAVDANARAVALSNHESETGRAALREPADNLGTARRRAIDSYKGSLSTELNKVRSLIVTRDGMYKEYLAAPRAVKIKPSRPVSSRNKDLEQIRKEMESAQTMQTLAMLSKDVREIKTKMADDIAVFQRMNRF